jgi:hypothetical protein
VSIKHNDLYKLCPVCQYITKEYAKIRIIETSILQTINLLIKPDYNFWYKNNSMIIINPGQGFLNLSYEQAVYTQIFLNNIHYISSFYQFLISFRDILCMNLTHLILSTFSQSWNQFVIHIETRMRVIRYLIVGFIEHVKVQEHLFPIFARGIKVYSVLLFSSFQQ